MNLCVYATSMYEWIFVCLCEQERLNANLKFTKIERNENNESIECKCETLYSVQLIEYHFIHVILRQSLLCRFYDLILFFFYFCHNLFKNHLFKRKINQNRNFNWMFEEKKNKKELNCIFDWFNWNREKNRKTLNRKVLPNILTNLMNFIWICKQSKWLHW